MLNRLFARFGKRRVIITTVVVVAAIGGYFFLSRDQAPVIEEPATLPQVTVREVKALASQNTFNTVGTVSAVSEARLQTEASGRITSVSVKIGDTVGAGRVIATIEGGAQNAALVQAQGAYEAAVAGAAQSDSGSRDTQTALKSSEEAGKIAVQNAFTAVNGAIINSIDQFFSNPQGAIPGLRIDGNTSVLNAERVAYENFLGNWQRAITTIPDNEIESRLAEAETNVTRTLAFVDMFINETNNAEDRDLLDGLPVKSYTAGLLAERSALSASLQNIQGARAALAAAKEAVVRAASADTSGAVSLANAQVKIALGGLRSAQAAYEKTLVRSPISGVVNALYLKAGEYAAPGGQAAIIANNNGLEITTAVSEDDVKDLSIGDSVSINDTATGTITAIAGAIDPTTGKVAIKVSVDAQSNLSNGSTVTVTFTKKSEESATLLTIPLSAVKMTGSGPVIFTVTNENKLASKPVTLGTIRGANVVIESGLQGEDRIVIDARGLKEAAEVSVNQQ